MAVVSVMWLPRCTLSRIARIVNGREDVHVGEDEVAGAIAAEGGLVFAADDGEGVQDV